MEFGKSRFLRATSSNFVPFISQTQTFPFLVSCKLHFACGLWAFGTFSGFSSNYRLSTNLRYIFKLLRNWQKIVKELYLITGIQLLPNTFFWKTLYLLAYYTLKAVEWRNLMGLLRQAHVALTNANVYYWILNHMYFGIFGSWPLLRPDLFQQFEDIYCAYWSC